MNTLTTTHPVSPNTPKRHLGVERVELGLTTMSQMAAVMTPTRTLMAFILVASCAVSVAIADALLGTWGDEHLLAALAILAVVAVTTMVLLFPMSASVGKTLRLLSRRARQSIANARNEVHFWDAVNADPRMKEEIRAIASVQAGDYGSITALAHPASLSPLATMWREFVSTRAQARADAYTWACAKNDPRLMADLETALARPSLR
jgi:hypothetical protein